MAAQQVLPFAEQLRQYRRDRGLTQEQLGELAGLSARGIRALEQGERSSPHRDTVRLLAEALQLSGSQRADFEDAGRREVPHESQAQKDPVAGFLGARPPGPLVAREREMQILTGMAEAVLGGQGRLVMVAGESGIGKTRLAQEAALLLENRGFLVAAGRCYEPERVVPYYPFLEVLDTLYKSAPAAIRTEIPRRWDLVRRLLPESEAESAAIELGSQDVQARLFWAVTGFVLAVAHSAPLAVLLDDLHWADESSVKLLHHIARQARSDRVLLLGTYREAEVKRRDPLDRMLRDTQREGLLDEISLRRLGPSDTAALTSELLGHPDVPTEFVQLVYRYTDGNPFFTQEVLRALVERGEVVTGDGSWEGRHADLIEVPRSVRAAIGERLSRLSDDAQEILRMASVLGQTFSFDGLEQIAGCGEEQIEGGLGQALAADLVRESGKDAYTFNHTLIVQTLYEEIPSRRRRKLHLAVGAWLERLPEAVRGRRAPELAWHFLRGDDPERALRYSMLAGNGAEAVFAHSEAEQHYRTALDLAREYGDRGAEAAALEQLGIVLRFAGRYSDGLEVLEKAASLYRRLGSMDGEVRATQQVVFTHYLAGSPVEALSRVQRAVERMEALAEADRPAAPLADLYWGLAISLWPSARYEDVLAAGRRSAELARAGGEDRALAGALWVQGWAQAMVGPLPEARHALQEAAALFGPVGESWWLSQCHGNLGRTYLHEGNTQRAEQLLQLCVAEFELSHDAAETAWGLSYLGDVLFLRGDWDEAQRLYERAANLSAGGSSRYRTHLQLNLAELSLLRGEGASGIDSVLEILVAAERSGEVGAVRKANRLLAERDLEAGRPKDALTRLLPLMHAVGSLPPHAFPPPVLARAWRAVGDLESAEELVQQRERQFRDQSRRRSLVQWLPVKGMLHADREEWEEAEQAFEEGISLARGMPYPHAEGRILYEYGLMCAHRRQPDQARRYLGQAGATFQRLGAQPEAHQVSLALHDLA